MSIVLWTLDVVLCGSLVWLAVQTLATPDLFKAVVMFIVFSLLWPWSGRAWRLRTSPWRKPRSGRG